MISFRVFFVLLSILALVSVPMLGRSEGERTRSGIGVPDIIFHVDKPAQEIDVSPDGTKEVVFRLTINCYIPTDAPEGTKAILDLRTKAGQWNVSEITDLSFDMPVMTHELNIKVTAPPNATASIVADLEVWGSWSYWNTSEWGSVRKQVLATITVLPFYDLIIGSNNPVKYDDVGKWTRFHFNITNRANRDINLTLDIMTDHNDVEFRIDNESIHLSKGETRQLSFMVKQEPSRSRVNTIHVYAKIEEDPTVERFEMTLYFYSEPTVKTFFYEANFIRLVIIIGAIVLVASGLFIWEKRKKKDETDTEEETPQQQVRSHRPLNMSQK